MEKIRVRHKMNCSRCGKTDCKTTQIRRYHYTEDGPMEYDTYLCDLCRGMSEL